MTLFTQIRDTAASGSRLRRRLRLGAVAALLLVAMACGEGDDLPAAETSDTDDTTTTTESAPETTTTAAETTTTAAPSTTPPPTTEAVPPTTEAPAGGDTSLTVTVTSDGQPVRDGSVTCSDQPSGTGFLAESQATQAACELLQRPEVQQRLVEGRDPNLICTQIYGGPEVASVEGTLHGQSIRATLDRTDGCAIAEWDSFAPLIGPAGN